MLFFPRLPSYQGRVWFVLIPAVISGRQVCHGGGGRLLHRPGEAEEAGLEDVQGGGGEEPDCRTYRC